MKKKVQKEVQKEKIIAYKVTDPDFTCRGTKYEVGSTVSVEGELKLCKNGIHFCRYINKCFSYYSFDSNNKVLEIEILGDYIGDIEEKECASSIRVLREIKWDEVLKLSNQGHNNNGHSNAGDLNAGGLNAGDQNAGNQNAGNQNAGHRNAGDQNAGNQNAGNQNAGHRNAGHRNAGHLNAGHRNAGDQNAGNQNAGHRNAGHRNAGHLNAGHLNAGDQNAGHLNSNSSDKIRIFNKWFNIDEASDIYFPSFVWFDLISFVSHDTATEEEKIKYKKEIEMCGGFVKVLEYKEAFKLSWDNANKTDRKKIKDIIGFDNQVFFDISGIDVSKELGE
jgi:hypothetical protein